MGVTSPSNDVRRFGIFEADLSARELRRNGVRIRLQEQPFQVLAVLLLNAGRLVTREELRHQVWPENTFVEFDHALNTAVKKIRIAIGDDASAPRYIETIPKRGYRFISPVSSPTDLMSSPVRDVLSSERRARPQLSRTTAAILGAVSLALIGTLGAYRMSTEMSFAKKVAVLPFENSSDHTSRESLCEGLTQELITQLARTDPAKLGVSARASVLQYQHTSKTVAQIGAELQADYLIEGNLIRDGRHIRVFAELIRVSDLARVWGDDFDGEDDGNLLELETSVAKAITLKVQSAVVSGGSTQWSHR